MSQPADIEAAPPARPDVARDDGAALADEVGRDLDQLFAPPPTSADPPHEPIRVAFVERPAARRRVMGLTLRDAALAASAAVAGVLAGVVFAPHGIGEAPRPAPAKPSPPAASGGPELIALSALAAGPEPASAPPPARSVRAPPPVAAAPAPRPVRAAPAPPAAAADEGEPLDRVDDGCAALPTLADEMVCDTPRLAAAQAALDSAYDAALAAADRPRALRREQADWLAQRDMAARRSEAALERFYRLRTDELWRRADEAEGYDIADDARTWSDDRR
jgi:uncharacterized protein YecT (DUF1311 family)